MAGSSASGRSPPPDGRATGKSGFRPLEALWKQEGAKCCQFLRNRAYGSRGAGLSNWRKCRRNTQPGAIVHGPFDTTHNLKVVGSNPTPQPQNSTKYQRLKLEQGAHHAPFPCCRAFPDTPQRFQRLTISPDSSAQHGCDTGQGRCSQDVRGQCRLPSAPTGAVTIP